MEYKVRKILSALIGLGTALVVVLAVPSAAVAVSPQPPGLGWRYGIPLASLPICENTEPGAVGGWDIREFDSDARASLWAPYGDITRPIAVTLGEVCTPQTPASINVADHLAVGMISVSLPIGSTDMSASGGSSPWASAQIGIGPRTHTANGVTDPVPAWNMDLWCASAEWSRDGTNRTVFRASQGSIGVANNPDPTDGAVYSYRTFNQFGFNRVPSGTSLALTSTASSTCQYLVRVDATVCEFHYEAGLTDPVRTCQLATWWADDFNEEKPYEDTRSPEAKFCDLYPLYPGCSFIDPEIDPSSPDICGAEIPFLWGGGWLDFSFVPSAFNHLGTLIRHYSGCLFTARDGFDRERWVANEYEESALAAIQGTVVNLADAASIEGACGVIVAPVEALSWGGANTCEWNAWSGPIRSALYVIVLGLSGLWLITFFTRIFTDTVNKRIGNPLDGGKS